MGALQPSKVEDVKLRYLRYMVWWAEQMSGDQQKKSEALENFRQQVGASDWQLPALGVGHCPFEGVARVLHLELECWDWPDACGGSCCLCEWHVGSRIQTSPGVRRQLQALSQQTPCCHHSWTINSVISYWCLVTGRASPFTAWSLDWVLRFALKTARTGECVCCPLAVQWGSLLMEQAEREAIWMELSLPHANFRLKGLAQAVCLKGSLPYQPSGQPSGQVRGLLEQPPRLYSAAGAVVTGDPMYQPPEVRGRCWEGPIGSQQRGGGLQRCCGSQLLAAHGQTSHARGHLAAA